MGGSECVKKRLGFEAVDRFVTSGMKLGLGTGSTAMWAVRRVAQRVREGGVKGLLVVATSLQSEIEARSLGLDVLTLNDASIGGALDLTIDGADEIDPEGNLIKGGGGAMLMEKIIAYSSRRFVIVAEGSKLSRRLGELAAVPIEIVSAALFTATRALEALGAEVRLRIAANKAGPVVTDLGNLLLDAAFKSGFNPMEQEARLNSIPGVLENGIFTSNKPELLIGFENGRVEHRKP
jgi:ribose 5-phosphate isomerase A